MDICPNCRARNPGKQQCRRCGMELSLLNDIEQAAETLTQLGVRQLTLHHYTTAVQLLQRACQLKQTDLRQALLQFARHQAEPGWQTDNRYLPPFPRLLLANTPSPQQLTVTWNQDTVFAQTDD